VTPRERRRLAARIARERGFTALELARLGCVADAAECAAEGIFPAAPGFLFMYPDSDMRRVRYVPNLGDRRYGQRAKSAVEAYYCPLRADWAAVCQDTAIPVLITEGEFKAAAACKAGFACIGLGGVFNFASARLRQTWLPSLDRVKWKGRKVHVVFDSDAADNPMVQLAETRLALRLTDRSAVVHIVRLSSKGAK